MNDFTIDQVNSKIIFNKIIQINEEYFGENGGQLEFNWSPNKNFLMIADLRSFENANLKILPTKIVEIDYIESISSYKLNKKIYKEFRT